MKGVNWSPTRKVLLAIIACFMTTVILYRDYYRVLHAIVIAITDLEGSPL